MRDRQINFDEAYSRELSRKHVQHVIRRAFTQELSRISLDDIVFQLEHMLRNAAYLDGGCLIKEPIVPGDFSWFDEDEMFMFALDVPNTNTDFSEEHSIRVNLLPVSIYDVAALNNARKALRSYAKLLDCLRNFTSSLEADCNIKPTEDADLDEAWDTDLDDELRDILDCMGEVAEE